MKNTRGQPLSINVTEDHSIKKQLTVQQKKAQAQDGVTPIGTTSRTISGVAVATTVETPLILPSVKYKPRTQVNDPNEITTSTIKRITETVDGTVVVVNTSKDVFINNYDEIIEQKYINNGVLNVGYAEDGSFDNNVNLVANLAFSPIFFEVSQLVDGTALVNWKETKQNLTGSVIDLNQGTFFTKTIVAATTLSVINTPISGVVYTFIIELTNGGTNIVNWWSGITWDGGVAPTLTSSGVDSIGFYTYDGGTTWRGLLLGTFI